MIILEDADLRLNRAVTFEYLYANGLGGYASSTIVGMNTRSHHGLLVSALNPPVDRWLTLSRVDEVVATGDEPCNLGTEHTEAGVSQRGYRNITRFVLNPFPQMSYATDCLSMNKTVFMSYRRNITVINYEFKNTEETVLTVTPYQTCRPIQVLKPKMDFTPAIEIIDDHSYLSYDDRDQSPWMYAYTPDAEFMPSKLKLSEPQIYRKDKAKGIPHKEELYIPGVFHTILEPGEHYLSFLFAGGQTQKLLMKELGSLANATRKDFAKLRFDELRRRQILLDRAFSLTKRPRDEDVEWLVYNADTFIVDRASTGRKSVLAGFHELVDIGLDAVISHSGLSVAIGRFQDAREILTTYARYSRYGLIANDFPDRGIQPEYDSVDASLWFILAVKKYIDATSDIEFLRGIIWETMESIITAYRIGTKFNIHEDHDGLIFSGLDGVEVSWMNERIGEWCATPRIGKCVEVNALWYNALMAMGDMSQLMGRDPYEYKAVASWIREAFIQSFWDEKLGYLYDLINDEEQDESLRPNQIIALSLPYRILEPEMERSVLDTVQRELLTPYGLRTLDTKDKRYARALTGGPKSRAGATHQGTVHPWLIGPFISAYLSVHGRTAANKAYAEKEFFRPVLNTIRSGCLGTISDMFDGSKPHRDRGVVSRARNVAELLRVYFQEL